MNVIENMLFRMSPPSYLAENDAALKAPSSRLAPSYLANLTPFLRLSSETNR